MSTYKYPNKIPFYKFLVHSSAIAKNPIPFHQKWFKNNNDSFSVQAPFVKRVMLTRDAEMAKHILQKNNKTYHKSKIQTKFLSKYVGYGLLTSSGDYWLKQRRLIQPGFHKEKIKNLISIIDQSIETELDAVETGQTIPLYPVMNKLAFEVVAKSLFNFSTERETLRRLQFIIEKLQQFITTEIRQPHKKIWYTLNGEIRYHMKLVKESRTIIGNVIGKRKQSTETHDDLLQMLLDSRYEDGSAMTNNQLIDEILILFVAGHETTANALTFTLTLLAQHPEILSKAQKEADNVSLESFSKIETISKLNYITQCINESLRLYPPAWITDRVAIEDDRLGDYYIKKGTIVGVSIYELHRSAHYWKQPNQFLPERFNDDKAIQKSGYYMPFGAGPRLCIGNNFAMFEMILTVYETLKRFNITTPTKTIKVNPLITLKPVDLELKFSKRTRD